jgi:D-beta-D-heptose 7-phosphate kinase/D-beta-D-heptose 1-phosphate adenosyltransferase
MSFPKISYTEQQKREFIEVWDRLQMPKLIVLGDLMLDKYTWGDVERISPEAPVPVLRHSREECRLGGAGNVGANLRKLGCEVTICSLLGLDQEAALVKQLLRELGISPAGLQVSPEFRTVLKHRLIAKHNHLLRLDQDPPKNFQFQPTTHLIQFLKEEIEKHDGVVISDYDKGFLAPELLKTTTEIAAKLGKKVLVDPRAKGDYSIYRGASLIKPNRKEATAATGIDIHDYDTAKEVAKKLVEDFGVETSALSLDEDGLITYNKKDSWQFHPTVKQEVYDVVGAGDMVISVLAAVSCAGASLQSASYWSQVAASLEIRHVGVVSLSRDEIRNEVCKTSNDMKRISLHDLLEKLSTTEDQPIIFTNGYFDNFGIGHLKFLSQLIELDGIKIVAINSDASIKRKKGSVPLLSETERVKLLSTLAAVDYILVFDDDNAEAIIQAIKPTVVVKGERFKNRVIEEMQILTEVGAQITYMPEYYAT